MSSEPPFRPSHRRTVSSPIHLTRKTPQESSLLFRSMKPTASTSDQQPSTSQRPRTTSRLMSSVKRTLSSSTTTTPKKRPSEHQSPGMHSTRAESSAPMPFQQFRDPDPAISRPTVEQIAMGLHLSRTPHLRQTLPSSPYAFPQRNAVPLASRSYEHHHDRSQHLILPPPPSRSSMKKPSTSGTTATSSSSSPMISPPFSSASESTTTVTSVTPSSAAQSAKSTGIGGGIKSRMARLLPHGRSSSAPTSLRSSPSASPRSSMAEGRRPHHHTHRTKKAVRFNTEESVGTD